MSSTVIIQTEAIPGANIGGGTITTALIGLDVDTLLKTGPAAQTVPVVSGVRVIINGAAAFQCPITHLRGFQYDPPELDGGNTVTSEYGFYCDDPAIGTNRYGFFSVGFTEGYELFLTRSATAFAFIGPNLGIGGDAALEAEHPVVISSENATTVALQITGEDDKEIGEVASFSTAPVPTLRGWGSRGTAAAPTQTQSGDTLLRLAGTATDNAGTPAQTSVIAAIDFVAAQNITTAAQGTKINFGMCPAGSTTLTTFVTMEAGLMTIAGQTTPELRLDSSGDSSEYLSITRTSTSGVAKAMNHVATPGQSYSILSAGGGSDFVEFGTSITADTDGFSVSFWAKFPTTGSALCCFERGQDGSGNGWSMIIEKQSSDKMAFSIVTSAPAQVDCIGTSTLSANTWYHILCIWNKGNNLKLYVNGTLETTSASAATQLRSSTVGWRGFLRNGAAGGSSYLDAIQIWKNVYVDSDAANLAAGGDPATTPNFQYKINEGTGTTLTNTGSTTPNNGTLNGTITWSTNIPSANPLAAAGSTTQVTVWKSEDVSNAGISGLATFGDPAGITKVTGGQRRKRTTTAISYTALLTDYIIGVTNTGAARTITLPPASEFGDGFILIVKDESGGAGTNNITIDADGSETIDGATTKVINTNYGAVRLYCTGTAWFTW